MSRATIICDASFCPRTHAGGWACWININGPNGEHERIKKSGIFHKRPRNSEHAEQLACMNSLWFAYRAGAFEILVQTDCLALVQTSGLSNSRLGSLAFREAAAEHWPNAHVRWRHVKGHTSGDDSRTWVNNFCDKEAKKHMRKQRDAGFQIK